MTQVGTNVVLNYHLSKRRVKKPLFVVVLLVMVFLAVLTRRSCDSSRPLHRNLQLQENNHRLANSICNLSFAVACCHTVSVFRTKLSKILSRALLVRAPVLRPISLRPLPFHARGFSKAMALNPASHNTRKMQLGWPGYTRHTNSVVKPG